MSTSTVGSTPRGRVVSGPLALVFLVSFGALSSFYLLLSVTPVYAAAAGAGSAGAGSVTGTLLLGTVAAEFATPSLMNRYGSRAILAAGALLMGVPVLALLAPVPFAVIVAVSLVRGLGFGLGSVVAGALVPMLLPPERRGEGLGLSGIVDCVPEVVVLPLGLWLAGHHSFTLVIILTVATALAPLAALPWLPATADLPRSVPSGLVADIRQGGQMRLPMIFAASTVAAGVFVSFLPLADGISRNTATLALFTQAMAAAVSRWWAGRVGDRHGHAQLLVPGLALASSGMAAMVWIASPAAVVIGACLFGTGFGCSANATFALMIDRVPATGFGTASALWNLAYDAGFGAGPAVFGLLVTHTGYPVAFALTAALTLTALPMAFRERSTVPPAIPDTHRSRPDGAACPAPAAPCCVSQRSAG